jgi:hypothetical protein
MHAFLSSFERIRNKDKVRGILVELGYERNPSRIRISYLFLVDLGFQQKSFWDRISRPNYSGIMISREILVEYGFQGIGKCSATSYEWLVKFL